MLLRYETSLSSDQGKYCDYFCYVNFVNGDNVAFTAITQTVFVKEA